MKYNGIECDFHKIKDYNKPNKLNTAMDMIQKYFDDIQTKHNEYMKIKAFELIERKKKNPYNKEKYILFYTIHDISDNGSNISFINCSETAESYEEALAIEERLNGAGIRAVGLLEYSNISQNYGLKVMINKKVNKGNNDRTGEYKTPKKCADMKAKYFKENPNVKTISDILNKFAKEKRNEENKRLRNKLNKYIELLETELHDYEYQIAKCEDLGFIDMIPTYSNLINTTNEYIEELKGILSD